ncbi:hypothetical protein RIF29_19631 [Crotalaria pallida]|uniref:Arf-GAP domain-containing protein n=1 Tax=Crotalaria pallida TaxID=3830 RepID=A0AAN9EZU6_CROPI
MGSRKEEEKNEKIIRGLMKLPPNRRCINCNSMGPQYVCISFWTFVCVTCSGIHREFTHRVKSVSMAKFSSQEVDALQNGGNQRAREIYLQNWDFQRQRLPDSSNVDKIREFIRNVYVDRRYAGAKSSEKPPRDPQSPRIQEDDIRRASSYHSFSQSPPYDYQYEDRRYGKQAAALTRKPGSDKVRYEGKMSSMLYSPGRFSDHVSDDRFANEGPGPRISDFSVSSAGDQFKSEVQSPKFHKDVAFNSPSYRRSGSKSIEDVWSQARNNVLETNARRDAEGIFRPQRTTSLQSTDSNFSSLRSYNSGGLVDFFSEPAQASGSLQNKAASAPQTSGPTRSVSMDLSKSTLASDLFPSSASSVDLFQLPTAPSQASSADLFQSSVLSAAPSFNAQASGSLQNKAASAPQTSGPTRSVSMDLSKSPLASDLFPSSTSSVDLFQLPTAPSQASSADLFQSSVLSAAPSFNENQPKQTSQPSSIDFFADVVQQPSTETSAAPSHVPLADLFQSSALSAAPSFNQNQPRQTFLPPSIDLFADHFQQPCTATSTAPSQAPSVDLFHSSVSSAAPSFNENQPTQTSQTQSIDFFPDFSLQPSTATSDEKSLELSCPENEGWAAFDMPQSTSSTAQVGISAAVPSSSGFLQERFDPFPSFNANMQLSSFENSSVSAPPSSVTSNIWHDGVWNGEEQVSSIPTNTQPWNAFEDSGTHLPVNAFSQGLQLHNFPSADNQFLGSRASEFGGSKKDGVQGIGSVGGFDNHHDVPSHVSGSQNLLNTLPLMGDMQPNGINSKSTNPFDYPYDSDVEHTMFLDMSSLQAALPEGLLPATFNGGIDEPWLPQNMVTPYISSAGQGGLSFMAAQPLSSQIQNVQTQESVASFGGNPFA